MKEMHRIPFKLRFCGFRQAGTRNIRKAQKGMVIKMKLIIALIGVLAAALLIYYVYILMKGDEQK